ncbi:MAG: hypothetical protein J5537_09205 [Lachnospiraceae bacterium]|nr:hypothetical protein [Lachnospiraceae bacterium]
MITLSEALWSNNENDNELINGIGGDETQGHNIAVITMCCKGTTPINSGTTSTGYPYCGNP